MKLKICGMRDQQNISAVSGMGIDYMGFIFYAKSPRFVGEDFKMPLVPGSVKKVGVFVNESTQAMMERANMHGLQYLQLHGDESVAQCETLKGENIGIIKVFSVDREFSFDRVKPYKKTVDFFLFDTKGKYYGGNAVKFDWTILNTYDQEIPFFLSGGINSENLDQLDELKGMNMHAIDLNSGIESAPAMKDIQKIKSLQQQLIKLSQTRD